MNNLKDKGQDLYQNLVGKATDVIENLKNNEAVQDAVNAIAATPAVQEAQEQLQSSDATTDDGTSTLAEVLSDDEFALWDKVKGWFGGSSSSSEGGDGAAASNATSSSTTTTTSTDAKKEGEGEKKAQLDSTAAEMAFLREIIRSDPVLAQIATRGETEFDMSKIKAAIAKAKEMAKKYMGA